MHGRGPFCPSFPPSVLGRPWHSSPFTQLPSDTKLRSPRCTRSPVRFPGHPVSIPPSSFATLLCWSFSSLFHGARYPRFLPRGPVPPFPRLLDSYLAEPRILFARVIVLLAFIPGETRARSAFSPLRVLCSR